MFQGPLGIVAISCWRCDTTGLKSQESSFPCGAPADIFWVIGLEGILQWRQQQTSSGSTGSHQLGKPTTYVAHPFAATCVLVALPSLPCFTNSHDSCRNIHLPRPPQKRHSMGLVVRVNIITRRRPCATIPILPVAFPTFLTMRWRPGLRCLPMSTLGTLCIRRRRRGIAGRSRRCCR